MTMTPLTRDHCIALIHSALEELHAAGLLESLPDSVEDTPLFGKGGVLDSMALVNLIVTLEDRLDEAIGDRLVLADERAMSATASPFRSANRLADYILQQLEQRHA
jgi:D-alanine--poly(phosphoribitol) ligase subunit 2